MAAPPSAAALVDAGEQNEQVEGIAKRRRIDLPGMNFRTRQVRRPGSCKRRCCHQAGISGILIRDHLSTVANSGAHLGFNSLRNLCPMNCGIRVRIDKPSAQLQRDVDRIDELWSEGLTRFGGPFLAGNRFGAVDAFFAPVAFRIQTYGLGLRAAAKAYAGGLLGLPSKKYRPGMNPREPEYRMVHRGGAPPGTCKSKSGARSRP